MCITVDVEKILNATDIYRNIYLLGKYVELTKFLRIKTVVILIFLVGASF